MDSESNVAPASPTTMRFRVALEASEASRRNLNAALKARHTGEATPSPKGTSPPRAHPAPTTPAIGALGRGADLFQTTPARRTGLDEFRHALSKENGAAPSGRTLVVDSAKQWNALSNEEQQAWKSNAATSAERIAKHLAKAAAAKKAVAEAAASESNNG